MRTCRCRVAGILALMAGLGKASAGVLARDWQPSATRAAPGGLAAAVEAAGRDGGRRRLAMAATLRQAAFARVAWLANCYFR